MKRIDIVEWSAIIVTNVFSYGFGVFITFAGIDVFFHNMINTNLGNILVLLGGFMFHYIWGLCVLVSKIRNKRRLRWLKQFLPLSAETLIKERFSYLNNRWRNDDKVYKIDNAVSFIIENDGEFNIYFYFNNVEDGWIKLNVKDRRISLSESMKIVEQKLPIIELFSTKIDKNLLNLLHFDKTHEMANSVNKEFDTIKQAEKAMELLGI